MTRASQGMIWLRIQVSVIATFKMIYLNHLINEGDKTISRDCLLLGGESQVVYEKMFD